MISNLENYLWHGYLPPRDVPNWLSQGITVPPERPEYTPEHAARELDELFEKLTPETQGPHLVPLSGGWDSRIVLGSLMERVKDLHTISIGAPGQLDYDIGKKISRNMGTRHHEIDLSLVWLAWDDLIKAAEHARWTYTPAAFFLRYMHLKGIEQSGAHTIWSGFLGDPLSGGHYQSSHSNEDTAIACQRFKDSQRRPSEQLTIKSDPALVYPDIPQSLTRTLNYTEFLDFNIRQRGCIGKIVLGHDWNQWDADQGNITSTTKIIAPFADPQWARYWLHAPRMYHVHQTLYRQMAHYRFPKLFDLPSKHSWGVDPKRKVIQSALRYQHILRNRLHARFPIFPFKSNLTTNYIDFHRAFQKRDDYRTIVEKASTSLMRWDSDLGNKTKKLLLEHEKGIRDNSQTLLVLVGLAINVEANGLSGN